MKVSAVLKLTTSIKDKLYIMQLENGYRFSIDSIILTSHINPSPESRIIDIGCGCGIMSLILAYRYNNIQIYGIEIQKKLAEIALLNVKQNQMRHKINIIYQDINDVTTNQLNGPVDFIISNPPYRKEKTGRINPDSQKAIARHEIKLNIDTLFANAKRLLVQQGKTAIIFPAERLQELIMTMHSHGFYAEYLKFIHFKKGQEAKRVLIFGTKTKKGESRILPPLFVWDGQNRPCEKYKNTSDALLGG